MSDAFRLRPDDPPVELAEAVETGFLAGALVLDATGPLPELGVVRPLVEGPGDSWAAWLSRLVDSKSGANVGITADDARLAATLACDLAAWTGDHGREVALIDANVERPAVDKPLREDADEGLVDAVLFGVTPERVARRTLAPGVRVVTAGSHPLSVSKALDPTALRAFAAALAADLTIVVVPAAHVSLVAPSLDAIVVAGDHPERLLATAVRARNAGTDSAVAVHVAEARVAEASVLEEPGAKPEGAVTPGFAPEREPEVTDSPFLTEPVSAARPAAAPPRSRSRARTGGIVAVVAVVVAVSAWVLLGPGGPLRRDGQHRPAAPSERDLAAVAGDEPGGPAAREEEREDGSRERATSDRTEPSDRGADAAGRADGVEIDEPVEATTDAPPAGVTDAVAGGTTEDVAESPPVDTADRGALEPSDVGAGPISGPGGPYVVCLSSHKHAHAAEADVRSASGIGVDAIVLEIELPERGTWHRVVVRGGYPSLAEARNVLDSIKELGYEGAWIVRAKRGS